MSAGQRRIPLGYCLDRCRARSSAARLPRSGRPWRFPCAVRSAERLGVTDCPPKCTVSLRWVRAVTLQDVKPPLAFFRRADIANDPSTWIASRPVPSSRETTVTTPRVVFIALIPAAALPRSWRRHRTFSTSLSPVRVYPNVRNHVGDAHRVTDRADVGHG